MDYSIEGHRMNPYALFLDERKENLRYNDLRHFAPVRQKSSDQEPH